MTDSRKVVDAYFLRSALGRSFFDICSIGRESPVAVGRLHYIFNVHPLDKGLSLSVAGSGIFCNNAAACDAGALQQGIFKGFAFCVVKQRSSVVSKKHMCMFVTTHKYSNH